MTKRLELTLACGDYEIVRTSRTATSGRTASSYGADRMDSSTRHWRFLRNQEFDIAEVSGSVLSGGA